MAPTAWKRTVLGLVVVCMTGKGHATAEVTGNGGEADTDADSDTDTDSNADYMDDVSLSLTP